MKNKILPSLSGIISEAGKIAQPAVMFILVLLLTSFTSRAEVRESSLQLTLWNHDHFIVEFDGKRYPSDCEFILDDVRSGVHRIRVYSQDHHDHYGQSGHVTIHYDGRLEIPHASKMIAQINSCGEMEVIDVVRNGQHSHASHNHNDPRPRPRPVEYKPQQHQHDQPGWCGTPPYGNDYGMNTMSSGELDQLISQLENAWDDGSRLSIARQALNNNRVHTDQVKEIMTTFWFEKNRLEFAKSAYHQVSDPENYYRVNDVFWFSSSVAELEDYIREEIYTYNH